MGWAAGGALLPAYTAEQAFLPELAVLQRNIERVRAWRLGDFLAKTVRECTLFAVEQTATRFCAVLREEAEALAPLLAAPDSAISSGQVFKDGGTTTVARARGDGRGRC
jgi:hypothetical protein